MKYNFNQPILNLAGEPYEENSNPITFTKVLSDTIIGVSDTPPDKKIQYFNLAQKIYNAQGEVEITVEEVAIIKTVALMLPTISAAQIVNYLENAKAE